MELIEAKTLTTSTASVTFSSIPQTYTDLKIVISARGDYAALGSSYKLSFNGSSSNFSIRALEGAGSGSPSSFTGTQYIGSAVGATATADAFNNAEIYIPNYLSTTTAKSFSVDAVSENNGTEAYADLIAGLWNPGTQAAIYSVGLTPTSGNFVANSTFYLYGISNVTSTTKATGGTITTDGTYWIHTFTSSGTFVPYSNLTTDYLVVAGGGGGGTERGGGGGAGGFRYLTGQSLTGGTSYTVTIGAGGSATATVGNSGVNSSFSSTSASGGGGGASPDGGGGNGVTGGSGGGAVPLNGTKTGGSGNSGSYSPVEGYAGGNATGDAGPAYGAGGGGGSSVVGSNGSASVGGNGGAGTANSISGSSVTYAGGGGGGTQTNSSTGTGGAGGGGNASTGGAAGNGTTNLGGGGGGGGRSISLYGGNGGSGIVIVRYAI